MTALTPGRVCGRDRFAVVRPASTDDAECMSALCAEHATFERLPFAAIGHSARMRAVLATGEPPLFGWVVEAAGQIAGYATASPAMSTLDAAPYLHLDCLYLRPAYRGQGTGRQLLMQAAALGVQLGYERMEWQTPDWNEAAARFYRRHGACERAKRRFYLDLPAPRSADQR